MAPRQLHQLAPQSRIDVPQSHGELAQGRVSEPSDDLLHGLLGGRLHELGFGHDRAVYGGSASPAAFDQPSLPQA